MPEVPRIHGRRPHGGAEEGVKAITDAVVTHFATQPEVVTVQIIEAKKTDKAKGGIPFSER